MVNLIKQKGVGRRRSRVGRGIPAVKCMPTSQNPSDTQDGGNEGINKGDFNPKYLLQITLYGAYIC